jgi:hypothetical protein
VENLSSDLAKQLDEKGIIVFEDVKDVIMKSKWGGGFCNKFFS